MHRSKVTLYLFSLLLVAMLAVDIRAQAVYGSITGTVTDPQGASVVGATVTVTNIDQSVSTSVKTNDSGFYNATHLIPGRYQVKVEQPGHKTATIEVGVKADVAATTDVALEVGAVSETVTISSEALELSLKTDRSDVATTF